MVLAPPTNLKTLIILEINNYLNNLKTMKTMNRIKSVINLTALVLVGLVSSSCSSDDNDNQATIVGTWLEVSSTFENFKNDISTSINTITADANNFTEITFNSDETFSELNSTSTISGEIETIETETFTGTYSNNGSTLLTTYTNENYTNEVPFTLSGDVLTLINTNSRSDSENNELKVVTTGIYNRQ